MCDKGCVIGRASEFLVDRVTASHSRTAQTIDNILALLPASNQPTY